MYKISANDKIIIARAFSAATNSEHRCRHGVVIKKGSRYASGWNKMKNSPKYIWGLNTSVHAEQDALRKHCSPDGAVCYSVRLDRKNNLALAKPCNNCVLALNNANIKRVIYSDPFSPSQFRLMLLN